MKTVAILLAMSLKLIKLAKTEKSIDLLENDKDVREIGIHLAEVPHLIDPFDFAPALTLHSGFKQRTFETLIALLQIVFLKVFLVYVIAWATSF